MSPKTRLGCERLETRENPAGNVTAAILPDGMLYIEGDINANVISVQQNAAGDLFVFGRGSTTVNGQTGVYLGRGIPSSVLIRTGDGNDTVEMIGVRTTGWLAVETGAGDDGMALYGCQAGALALKGNSGNDLIYTDGVYVQNYAEVDGGAGTDTVDFRRYGLHGGLVRLPNVEQTVGGQYGSENY